jgi:intein/homing endonuclease
MALMDFNKKEAAYMLGFIWADGWIRKNKYHREVRVECLREDIEEIKPNFDKVFDWKIYYRNRPNRRPQARLNLVHLEFVDYLLENGYSTNRDANKALSIIPEDLQFLWFRGLIDGDGCWYVNKEKQKRQFSISASYELDWSFIEDLFLSLDINSYRIYKREHASSKSSVVEFNRKDNFLKLGNFIYRGFQEEKIGLMRKYLKWQEILNSYVRK